jgi:hypothetical protein
VHQTGVSVVRRGGLELDVDRLRVAVPGGDAGLDLDVKLERQVQGHVAGLGDVTGARGELLELLVDGDRDRERLGDLLDDVRLR